jgi:cell division protein ZapD
VPDKLIYEQPLNERIRSFLRLEFLFQQVRHHLEGSTEWDSRSALSSMLEIMAIFGRSDLKSEVMKELERHTATLARLEQNPEVDSTQLSGLLADLDVLNDQLHAISGPIGARLKTHEFLNTVQQRSAIPGGTCDFDVPEFHFWLQRSADDRLRDLGSWLETYDVIGRAIHLILRLTRESTLFRRQTAAEGFFQKGLDPNVPCQLVRVALPADTKYFAEISGGRHRFTIRFMEQPSVNERATQTRDDVDFELACCII